MSAARWARERLVTLVVAAAVVLAIALRRPLLAWFTGQRSGEHGAWTSADAGPYALRAALDPDPPREKGNTLVLEIKDTSGKPVDDATVTVDWDMPAMGAMAEMKGPATVSHERGGIYRAAFDVPMGGSWTLQAAIHGAQGDATPRFTMTVGTRGLAVDEGTAAGSMPTDGARQEPASGVVTIDAARRQLIGVRTAPVTLAPMRDSFRAVGLVTYDESALADVNLRVRGWITRLYVDETGVAVTRGQRLFDLYSPDVFNAEQDYLLALHGAGGGDAGAEPGLVGAARVRLRLLGVSDAAIDALRKRGSPPESVGFEAPTSGFVIEKNVVEGAAVEPGTKVYRIAALGRVWVEAEVYEADLANVHVGQPATVTLDYLPGRSYDAKVQYVYPYLDSKSRTGRVRVELRNHDLELRPGMYANLLLSTNLGERIQVPASAVVYTGPRRLVFVDRGEGHFEPREIVVGFESNGQYEVLSGLRPSEIVATSGVFLIAAEARIRTAAKYWESP